MPEAKRERRRAIGDTGRAGADTRVRAAVAAD